MKLSFVDAVPAKQLALSVVLGAVSSPFSSENHHVDALRLQDIVGTQRAQQNLANFISQKVVQCVTVNLQNDLMQNKWDVLDANINSLMKNYGTEYQAVLQELMNKSKNQQKLLLKRAERSDEPGRRWMCHYLATESDDRTKDKYLELETLFKTCWEKRCTCLEEFDRLSIDDKNKTWQALYQSADYQKLKKKMWALKWYDLEWQPRRYEANLTRKAQISADLKAVCKEYGLNVKDFSQGPKVQLVLFDYEQYLQREGKELKTNHLYTCYINASTEHEKDKLFDEIKTLVVSKGDRVRWEKTTDVDNVRPAGAGTVLEIFSTDHVEVATDKGTVVTMHKRLVKRPAANSFEVLRNSLKCAQIVAIRKEHRSKANDIAFKKKLRGLSFSKVDELYNWVRAEKRWLEEKFEPTSSLKKLKPRKNRLEILKKPQRLESLTKMYEQFVKRKDDEREPENRRNGQHPVMRRQKKRGGGCSVFFKKEWEKLTKKNKTETFLCAEVVRNGAVVATWEGSMNDKPPKRNDEFNMRHYKKGTYTVFNRDTGFPERILQGNFEDGWLKSGKLMTFSSLEKMKSKGARNLSGKKVIYKPIETSTFKDWDVEELLSMKSEAIGTIEEVSERGLIDHRDEDGKKTVWYTVKFEKYTNRAFLKATELALIDEPVEITSKIEESKLLEYPLQVDWLHDDWQLGKKKDWQLEPFLRNVNSPAKQFELWDDERKHNLFLWGKKRGDEVLDIQGQGMSWDCYLMAVFRGLAQNERTSIQELAKFDEKNKFVRVRFQAGYLKQQITNVWNLPETGTLKRELRIHNGDPKNEGNNDDEIEEKIKKSEDLKFSFGRIRFGKGGERFGYVEFSREGAKKLIRSLTQRVTFAGDPRIDGKQGLRRKRYPNCRSFGFLAIYQAVDLLCNAKLKRPNDKRDFDKHYPQISQRGVEDGPNATPTTRFGFDDSSRSGLVCARMFGFYMKEYRLMWPKECERGQEAIEKFRALLKEYAGKTCFSFQAACHYYTVVAYDEGTNTLTFKDPTNANELKVEVTLDAMTESHELHYFTGDLAPKEPSINNCQLCCQVFSAEKMPQNLDNEKQWEYEEYTGPASKVDKTTGTRLAWMYPEKNH